MIETTGLIRPACFFRKLIMELSPILKLRLSHVHQRRRDFTKSIQRGPVPLYTEGRRDEKLKIESKI